MSENNKVTADMQVKDFGPDAQKENASAVITQVEVEKLLDSNEKGNLYKAVAEMVKSAGEATAARSESTNGITPEAILERIDRIIADSEHIKKAIDTIGAIDDVSIVDEIVDGINNTVNEREKTNRQIITLLQDMYNSAMKKSTTNLHEDRDVQKLNSLAEVLKDKLPPEQLTDILKKSMQQMFVEPGAAVVMH